MKFKDLKKYSYFIFIDNIMLNSSSLYYKDSDDTYCVAYMYHQMEFSGGSKNTDENRKIIEIDL